MGRMIFDLTDEDREALERARIKLGCRSHAETLRRLIRGEDAPMSEQDYQRRVLQPAVDRLSGKRDAISIDVGVAVPLHRPKAFNPQPKQGKKP